MLMYKSVITSIMHLITDESCRLDKVTCITEVRIADMHACLKLYI